MGVGSVEVTLVDVELVDEIIVELIGGSDDTGPEVVTTRTGSVDDALEVIVG